MTSGISLKDGVNFHGHLGPYLVLGILAGELALKELGCKKHFGLEVKVWGATQRPKSCIIDGLQLSTGATFGKGNISKLSGHILEIEIICSESKKRAHITIKDDLRKQLERVSTHAESKSLARAIYKPEPCCLFNLTINNRS